MKYKYIFILLLLLALLPSIWNLLGSGFFQSDDGEWMVIRFSAFYSSLSDGQFPVRFLERLNHGFGYPVSNFLYPGFMYFAVPIKLLGLSFVSSIKIVLILSMIGGGLFTFKWLSKVFDERSSLVGAVFYTYTPYHLFDLYKRGSVGEIFSLLWVPLILWAIEEKNKFFITVGVFLLAISHNSLFLLFLPVLFIYTLLRKKPTFKDSLISFSLGTLMSSFFWIPAMAELSYTNFSDTKISSISEYFASLNLIGASSIAVLLVSFLIVILRKQNFGKEVYLFLVLSLASVFLSSGISEQIWKILPSSFIQFPFRTLSYTVLASAFLAAFTVNFSKAKYIVMFLLIILAFLSSLSFLEPESRTNREDSFYSTNEGTTTVRDEYMPYWVKEKPKSRFEQKVEILSDGEPEVKNLTYNSKRIYFETLFESEETARVNTIYYPGWEANINGKEIEIDYSNRKGVMELKLPPGTNKVEFKFTETPLRIFANSVSVLSFLALILWTRKGRLKKWLNLNL